MTLRGLYEVETPLGQSEVEGVVRTHERLLAALHRNLFQGRPLRLKDLHKHAAPDLDYDAFRRWTTTLASPRLQGRYPDDPMGFYGLSDAFGYAGNATGFFTHLHLHPSFATWEGLPKRETRRTVLFPEDGLRTHVDSHGQVHVRFGDDELLVLRGSTGALVLAALVSRPGQALHALDLQAECAGHSVLGPAYVYDEIDAKCRLADFDIEYDASGSPPEVVARLAAVLRRIDILEMLEDSSKSLPKWADGNAEARKTAIIDDLAATMVSGPLRADHPLVKNAKKVVKRALDQVLEAPELARFRSAFEVGEFFTYRPAT